MSDDNDEKGYSHHDHNGPCRVCGLVPYMLVRYYDTVRFCERCGSPLARNRCVGCPREAPVGQVTCLAGGPATDPPCEGGLIMDLAARCHVTNEVLIALRLRSMDLLSAMRAVNEREGHLPVVYGSMNIEEKNEMLLALCFFCDATHLVTRGKARTAYTRFEKYVLLARRTPPARINLTQSNRDTMNTRWDNFWHQYVGDRALRLACARRSRSLVARPPAETLPAETLAQTTTPDPQPPQERRCGALVDALQMFGSRPNRDAQAASAPAQHEAATPHRAAARHEAATPSTAAHNRNRAGTPEQANDPFVEDTASTAAQHQPRAPGVLGMIQSIALKRQRTQSTQVRAPTLAATVSVVEPPAVSPPRQVGKRAAKRKAPYLQRDDLPKDAPLSVRDEQRDHELSIFDFLE